MIMKPQSENNKKIENPKTQDVHPQLRIRLQKAGLITIEDLAKASPGTVSAVAGLDLSQAEELCRSAAGKMKNEAIKESLQFTYASDLNTNNLERISTGSKNLDSLFGSGGIEPGAVTQFYGDPVTGKTQICHTLCVTLPPQYEVIYIDTEHRFRPERIMQISLSRGLDAQNILRRIN